MSKYASVDATNTVLAENVVCHLFYVTSKGENDKTVYTNPEKPLAICTCDFSSCM